MKKTLRFVLSILATTMTASCGGAEPTEEFAPSLDTTTKCTIKVVGEYSNFEALEAEFDRFKDYYPDVKFSYTKLDGSYEDVISTVLDGTEKPNIFFSYPKMMGNEKFKSVVNHMEDLSDPKLKLNLNCVRQSLINRDADGKVFMVPVFSRTFGTLVNENLFKKEGLNIPNNWTELLNVCKSLSGKGYVSPMMGYTKYDKKNGENKPSNGLMYAVAYPLFAAELAKDKNALNLANKLDPQAGQYTRGALEKVKQLFDNGCVNLEECDKIGDNYEKVLLRFFEGDVPMMVCSGDTVSGAKKREAKSEAFGKNPFNYSFYPIPATDQGGYFIDSPSLEFSVNKDCDNLDMTNEFMRFLIRTKELDNMASIKGLICSTKTTPFAPVYNPLDQSYSPIYNPFNKVPANRTVSPEVIGVKDQLTNQIKVGCFYVGRGELTVDQAVAKYGSFK